MATIRIATRGSAQASAQSAIVADRLRQLGFDVDMVVVETLGDRTQADNVPIHSIGGLGVFVKEVQLAVLDGRADVAVHSAKDLPSTSHEGLSIGAFTERRSPCDALIGSNLAELANGATVATGSVRRRAQLRRVRPDLNFVELRGNIGTRLGKVPEGGAIVMAVAALEILGLTDRVAEHLDPAEFVPAVGQGCVAVECRDGDAALLAALHKIDHGATRWAVEVERSFLAQLGSGCSMPVGAFVSGTTLFTFLEGDETGITVADSVHLSGDIRTDVHTAQRAAIDAHRRVLPP